MKVIFRIFWTFLVVIQTSLGEESYIQINFKRPINTINDKFISFSIDSKYLMNGYYSQLTNSSTENRIIEELGPAYIKLSMSPNLQLHDGATLEQLEESNKMKQFAFGIQEWRNLNKWALKHMLTAVIQLDYDSATWKPRDILRMLGFANDIGIKNCVWQLGSEINSTNYEKYLEDLKALDTMIKVFPKEKTEWKVIPANFKSDLDLADVDTFYESTTDIIDAVPYQQHFKRVTAKYTDSFQNKPSVLKYLLKNDKPVWLMLKSPLNNWSSFQECGSACIQESLFWAQLLGDAAKSGFSNVFKPLGKRDLVKPDFKYYITQLFKHLVDKKIFNVATLKGDKYMAHHYAFCSKNHTGGFVLMVINAGENRMKTEFKLASRYKKNTVLRYTLAVCGNEICLNDEKLTINHRFNPIVRKKSMKRAVLLNVPPMSVTFFDFPYLNVMECKDIEESRELESFEVPSTKQKRSSVDHLLQELALENLNNEKRTLEMAGSRSKRHLTTKLRDFNLFKQLTPTKSSNLNNGKILLVNKHQKLNIPGVNDDQSSIEEKIFKSSENNALPRGEMHLTVGSDKPSQSDTGDYDYVEFDDRNSKSLNLKRKSSSSLKVTKLQDDEDYTDAGVREKSVELDEENFFDAFGGEFVRPAKLVRQDSKNGKDLEIGEITAAKSRYIKSKTPILKNKKDENVQYAVLVKELQPTIKQNQMNMKKAKQKLAQMHMGEETQESTDSDRTDATQSDEDYEDYYHEEDEIFFNSGEEAEKTKRNLKNDIEDQDEFKNDRLINVVGKLLKKIENRVSEDNKGRRGSPVRTRRSVDSVIVPKRKTKKFTRAIKTKKISKLKPIDIKDIVLRKPKQLLRKKRFITWKDEDWKTNSIDSNFYETSNDIDHVSNEFSDENAVIFDNNGKDNSIMKLYTLRPTEDQIDNGDQQNDSDSKELDLLPNLTTESTDIVTVIAETYNPRTTRKSNRFSDFEGKVIDDYIVPFFKFFENMVQSAMKTFSSIVRDN